MSTRLSTPSDYTRLIDKYETWQGDKLIDGAVQRKKNVLFVTNNATKSRQSYKTKFDQLGLKLIWCDEIYGSAYATAVYISSVMNLPKDKKVYVIGMAGLEEERDEVVAYDPVDKTLESFSLEHFTLDPDLWFIATNEDSTTRAPVPGAGAISAPLRYALGKDPVSIGNQRKLCLIISRLIHFNLVKIIMAGDRLNTDILFGQAAGVSKLLFLTGITSESEITGPNVDLRSAGL
ncbi:hypothetical protein BT96DRAFT_963857 [Gymnopus androsaceus JB14]|uniref:4-nitrophenylphosphatase n=1 Tax=Gymnopus androsaceus JB14 TaxID=1447944 RepID=A0A6A4I511_9AGAR|nr:hypothetical protein BT96DRAFT_963857 [Gymnopus androsaceus JB14]